MQLVDLTQTTLSGLKLSYVQQKRNKLLVLSKLQWVQRKYMGGYKVARNLIAD